MKITSVFETGRKMLWRATSERVIKVIIFKSPCDPHLTTTNSGQRATSLRFSEVAESGNKADTPTAKMLAVVSFFVNLSHELKSDRNHTCWRPFLSTHD
jgi:hypothetical protein